MLQELPCQLSVCHIQTSPNTTPVLPHHPNKQGFFIGYFLTFHPNLISPLPSPPSLLPPMFSQSLSFNDAREERKRALKHSTHTSIQKQNSPNSATGKVIDALHLEGKSCSSHLLRSASHLQVSKQASKQGGGTERYLIFWSLLLTTQIGFHLLICNVSLFVCLFVFFSLEVETRGFSC